MQVVATLCKPALVMSGGKSMGVPRWPSGASASWTVRSATRAGQIRCQAVGGPSPTLSQGPCWDLGET